MPENVDAVAILCDIWSELLDVDVEPDDDFFDLGGYSLLIVNVVADARRHGLELTADQIYNHKTPAAIAAALQPGAGARAGSDTEFGEVWATGLSADAAPGASTLVTLAAEGQGTPVFCFHWGTGNVGFLSPLVDAFRGQRPVYGIQSVGLADRERPPLSLVEMAARYLRDIRTVQPEGPYLFVGPCAGGRIAYEIARQLDADGDQVAALVIANTMPPGSTEMDPGWGLRELYNFRLAALRGRFELTDLQEQQAALMRGMVEVAWLDDDQQPEELYWRQAVWAAGIFAQEHYEPRPYQGDLTVFQLAENADNEAARWDRVAPRAEVHTVDVPNTLSLLKHETFADIVAKKLAAYQG
ncbi:thioesterase domain-containing protein [Actinoplanes sp. KI2]|uniref:thioesterase domain-containing protein n=1 Tax=Actinoplanes sp. KI2 TaxID=2983315 RepID=UPI0021D5E60F|nr:thioesterase domain-containing protein [Actinoplanes sp. KI2]MCU7729690.1 thioesterase domain-containing protein [Actinoplanes sp. KI2]